MSTVVVSSTRRSRAGSQKRDPETVKTTAWYLAKFLCRHVNEATLERLREHVSRCRGIKTRVRLSRDGWLASGSGLLFMQKLKSVYVSFDHVRCIAQDAKFVNVLLCVFALDQMPQGIRYEIVAYKLKDSQEVRAIVDRFALLGGETEIPDEEDSIRSASVLGPAGSIIRAPSQHAMTMPGRPTNGSVVLDRTWSESGRVAAGPSRRYMSQSMGDLTGDVYYTRPVVHREPNGGIAELSDTRRALSTSYDRRGWASESASVAFFSDSDADTTNGVATAQVNGRMQMNGDSGVFDEADETPVVLVYSRPPSERGITTNGYDNGYTNTRPRQFRYRTNADSISLSQAPIVRSRSVEPLTRTYAGSVNGDLRSDVIYRTNGSGGGVVRTKDAPLYQHPTLVNPKFRKQYVQARTSTASSGGPVYRAASRSGPRSDYGGTRGYY